MDRRVKFKCQSYTILRRKHRYKSSLLVIDFSDNNKAQTTKAKVGKLDFIKIETFCVFTANTTTTTTTNNNNNNKGKEETLGSDGYIYDVDGSDVFLGVYYVQTRVVYIKYVQLFKCQSYFNKIP